MGHHAHSRCNIAEHCKMASLVQRVPSVQTAGAAARLPARRRAVVVRAATALPAEVRHRLGPLAATAMCAMQA